MSDAIGPFLDPSDPAGSSEEPSSLQLAREWNDLVEFFVADPGDFSGDYAGKFNQSQPMIPEALKEGPLPLRDIIASLRQPLAQLHHHRGFASPAGINYLASESTRAIITGETIASHLARSLDNNRFESLMHFINASTIHALHTLLHLPVVWKGYYRNSKQRARLLLSKLAITRKFPSYPDSGFQCFGDNVIPVIYATQHWGWLEELRYELGLPHQSLRIIKDNNSLRAELKASTEPKAATKTEPSLRPVLIIATLGGGPVGGGSLSDSDFKADEVSELIALAEEFKVWIHLEGSGLFLRAIKSVEKPLPPKADPKAESNAEEASFKKSLALLIDNIALADSFLINPYNLFGFHDDNKCFPTVFFRSDRDPDNFPAKSTAQPAAQAKKELPSYSKSGDPEPPPASSSSTGLSESTGPSSSSSQSGSAPPAPISKSQSEPIRATPKRQQYLPIDHGALSLSMYCALQLVGKETIRKQIQSAVDFTYYFHKHIEGMKLFYLLSAFRERVSNIEILSDEIALSVVFRYVPLLDEQNDASEDESVRRTPTHIAWLSAVNEQLMSDLRYIEETSQLDIDTTIVKGEIYLKFDPLFSNNCTPYAIFSLSKFSKAALDHFIDNLSLVVELIDATLRARPLFSAAVAKAASRRIFEVKVPRFVGLGAVRYLPRLISLDEDISETLQKEIDRFEEIVLKRLSEDAAAGYLFKSVVDVQGRKSIAIVVDSLPMTEARCEELVNKIADAATATEAEFDFSQQLASIVVSSIKEAEKKLKTEASRLESERGLLRKIPIFGSVYNWWSPVSTEVHGSSFDILRTTLSPAKMQRKPVQKRPESSSPVSSSSFVDSSAGVTYSSH